MRSSPIFSIRTVILAIAIPFIAACGGRNLPAELQGEWFQWRTYDENQPVLLLDRSGTATYLGRSFFWSYLADESVVELRPSDPGPPIRLRFSKEQRALVVESDVPNPRVVDGMVSLVAPPVFIKPDSPIRMNRGKEL